MLGAQKTGADTLPGQANLFRLSRCADRLQALFDVAVRNELCPQGGAQGGPARPQPMKLLLEVRPREMLRRGFGDRRLHEFFTGEKLAGARLRFLSGRPGGHTTRDVELLE